jgi:membrane-associated phospholipid phosphatase
MPRTVNVWFLFLIMTIAFVLVSVRWIDKPLVQFFETVIQREILPIDLVDRILSIPSIGTILFIALGLSAISGRRFSKIEATIALCVIATLITTVIKDQLKFIFGRSWPSLLLQQDVYGFHFFQSGKLWESFPSGHAAVAAALLSVVWVSLPKLRAASVIVVFAADLGLIVLYLHFLSDVVAGTFVGVSAALFTMAMWHAIAPAVGMRSEAEATSHDR